MEPHEFKANGMAALDDLFPALAPANLHVLVAHVLLQKGLIFNHEVTEGYSTIFVLNRRRRGYLVCRVREFNVRIIYRIVPRRDHQPFVIHRLIVEGNRSFSIWLKPECAAQASRPLRVAPLTSLMHMAIIYYKIGPVRSRTGAA